MMLTLVLPLAICMTGLHGVPVENEMPTSSDRTLYIRSLPGYPGVRSDLYEVYMEPYYYAIGTKATVELKAYNDNGMPVEGPTGILSLEQLPEGVRVTGTIMGLAQGQHGFHVHEKGDISKGCSSAGAHYNPYLEPHGGPLDPLRHVGDLGNIEAGADGSAQVDILDHYLTLTGVRGAVGRTIVVHEKPDDLGRGNSEDSVKTGSAGGRLACGIIGFV